MIYDGADKAIREMNRRNLKAWNLLKLAKWDEMSVIRQVSQTYDGSVRLAQRHYYEIAMEAYTVALYECKFGMRKASEMAEDTIDADWILAMLEEVDPVTLYAFLPETERKKQRLIETLTVAQDKSAEIDKSLKYWTVQIGQYAINVVDKARFDAFKAAGIERVRWNTAKDERVCEDCDPLDGKVFPIDAVPPKQHYNCRCYLTPA